METRSNGQVLTATQYADNSGTGDDESIEIPDQLDTLTPDELADVATRAGDAFKSLYGNGKGLTAEQADALEVLSGQIEKITAEQGKRSQAAAEVDSRAAEIAAKVGITPAEEAVAEAEATVDAAADQDDGDTAQETGQEAALVASGPRRITLPGVNKRRTTQHTPPAVPGEEKLAARMFATNDAVGLTAGADVDWRDIARSINRNLTSYNPKPYEIAARQGRKMQEKTAFASISLPFPDDLKITSESAEDADKVMRRATDESRLPGGSLVASGGWCAPSETRYDLCDLSSTDGMISLPEFQVTRGGIRYTQGADFSTVFANTGFCYTEAEDIAGDYDGAGGGSKPCFHVDCPPFLEERLGLCGFCLTGGLLQARGFPEYIEDYMRKSEVAHQHRLNAQIIDQMINGSGTAGGHTGSTPVVMPAVQVGATAPVLTAIELQVEHMRSQHRMARTRAIEAVFPYWVRGVIRADLSRRLGVDLLSVSDQQIDGWFRQRGVVPQFVYDWQDIGTTAASAFTSYPATIDFLLYPSGTWGLGRDEVINLGTIYDSTLLGTNDFTAAFVEEAYLTTKWCPDSRVITTGICADGATAMGVAIECDGTAGA